MTSQLLGLEAPDYWKSLIKRDVTRYLLLDMLSKRPMHGFDIAKSTGACCGGLVHSNGRDDIPDDKGARRLPLIHRGDVRRTQAESVFSHAQWGVGTSRRRTGLDGNPTISQVVDGGRRRTY